MEIPMLDEQEWAQVLPELRGGIAQIKSNRETRGVSIKDAKDQVYGQGASARYHQITGFRETNINALWHHRLSLFGPPCRECGMPLRTPRAKLCAACGVARD